MENLNKKKAVMAVAFRGFRDEEYFVPKEILEKAGIIVETASTEKGTAIGADGGEARVDLLLSEINLAEFSSVIFIGGPGCIKYLDNETSYKIIKETVSEGKILAAICISPIILAKAGVLRNKKATVWTNSLDKSAVKILKDRGAIYDDKPVVTEGKIITASGPTSAKEFGEAIVRDLTGS